MIKIAPSILAADPLNLERDVLRMTEAGCDLIHVDVMDGHFVPNLSFSPTVVAALRQRFPNLFLDVHLMMDNPEKYVGVFADSGASSITIHAEIPSDVLTILRRIHAMGVHTGLAVKPATPAIMLRDMLTEADMALVMTVEPGFGGQKLQLSMLDKLDQLRAMGYRGLLECDGGIKESNLPELIAHGLDVAVMGTALFRSADPAGLLAALHALG